MEKSGTATFSCYTEPAMRGPRWTRWLTSFELYADGKGLVLDDDSDATKQKRRALLLHLAGPDVQDIFSTLPNTGNMSDYAAAVAALNVYFVPQINTAVAQHAFQTISQNQDDKITIQRGSTLPAVNQCTVCCSMYHCPFCTKTSYKPSMRSKLQDHLQRHLSRAIVHDDYTIHQCGLGCRKKLHYHCVYCSAMIYRQQIFVAHLKVCKIRNLPFTASVSTTLPEVPPLTTIGQRPLRLALWSERPVALADRSEEVDASAVEQSHMGAIQPARSALPLLDPPSDDSPEIARVVTRTSSSSDPIAPSSPSTSHPDSFPDLPPPPPYPSSSSVPTHSSSFPAFPSSSSSPLPSYPASSIRPAPSHTSLPSSSPLHPTPDRRLSQARLGVEHLEELSHCASVSLEEQHQGRLVLEEVSRSLGSLAGSLQCLVETQREFTHDSLKMQREMVDTLRLFSSNALSLLRDKVDPPL